MRRFFFDTEFLDAGPGRPIELISIGVVGEDGSEFYRININAPWDWVASDPWLAQNVLPHLPGSSGPYGGWDLDVDDPAVRKRYRIRDELLEFLRPTKDDPVELWAWYGAYDWVVLCGLFGRMVDLPPGMPWYVRDLKQAVDQADVAWLARVREAGINVVKTTPYSNTVRRIAKPVDAHNALADARWLREVWTAVRDAGGVA